MSKKSIGIVLLTLSLLSFFGNAPAKAQDDGGWSEPYRISSNDAAASESYCVPDQYSFVHCFWTETLFENQNSVIKYSRFDGSTWTKPNDIYLSNLGVKNVSPVVDQQGILHIAWSEGLYDVRAYYTYAPANNALSVQNWADPVRINVTARPIYLQVDSRGVLHILYTNQTGEAGVYYIHSEDKGETWSEPLWLDPDILPNHIPDGLNFELDEDDGLHAVWWYGGLDRARPDWVRYAHSLDGGHTWSEPFLIDRYNEESVHNLNVASPKMIVQGKNVHVIWAAGELPYRYHRYSSNSGLTWSTPVQIFGELHGQAFDGLAVDGAGRVHFFAQIRYPMGIYHAIWDQARWSKPSLVYWISDGDSEEGFGDRVHAHFTLPVIRAGNQLILTFTDGPADPHRRLFIMNRTLADIPSLEPIPTPTLAPTLIPPAGPTQVLPETIPTATPAVVNTAGVQPLREIPKADLALQIGIIPVLLLLGATFIFRMWHKNRS